MRSPISSWSATTKILLLGSVSGYGLRAVDLSGELARLRSLPWFGNWETLSPGFRGTVSRSTLADANENRDWRIFAAFAHTLIATARPLYADDPLGVDLDHSLYALDSTTIDLCLALFPWAKFRKHKAAVKMHTLLDLHGNIPVFIRIFDGNLHDVHALDDIAIETGAFYVFDRGYLDFARLFRFTLTAAFFVTRTKENVVLQRRYSHPVDKSTGVRADQTVVLGTYSSACAYPEILRRITPTLTRKPTTASIS